MSTQIGPVTEELVFAVTNRTGLSFGVVSMVLFGAQAHQREQAETLAAVEPLPGASTAPSRPCLAAPAA